jgi:hypothetical protein
MNSRIACAPDEAFKLMKGMLIGAWWCADSDCCSASVAGQAEASAAHD